MSTVDSSFLSLTTRGPTSYSDPILPALTVALAYLDAVEGPLWVAVRGTGLAYGTHFTRDIGTGRLTFKVYRSPDALRAYQAAKKTVEQLANGHVELEDLAMEGAVSTVVVGMADEGATMGAAAIGAFVDQVIKGVGKEWSKEFLGKVRQVKKEQVRQVLQDVVMKSFEVGKADLLVTCSEVMREGMVKGFANEGWPVEIRTLGTFEDGYGMEKEVEDEAVTASDDDGEEDEEEEDDEDSGEGDEDDEDEEMKDEEGSDGSIVVVNKEDVEMTDSET